MFIYIILAIIVAAGIWGYAQGLIHQIGSVVGLVAAVVVCRVFGSRVADYACADLAPGSDATFVTILAYIALGLATYLCVWVIVRMAKGLVRGLKLGVIDKVAGAVYKMLLWTVVISLLYNVYVCVVPSGAPSGEGTHEVWKGRLLKFAPAIFGSESAREVLNQVERAVKND